MLQGRSPWLPAPPSALRSGPTPAAAASILRVDPRRRLWHAARFYAGSKYEAICLKKKELRPAASALGQLRISSLSGPNYARICTDVTASIGVVYSQSGIEPATFKRLQAEADERLRRRGDPIPHMSQLGHVQKDWSHESVSA